MYKRQNTAIAADPAALIYDRIDGWDPLLTEATNAGQPPVVVNSFEPVLLNGTSITPPASTTATILSVYEQGNPANTTNRAGNPYMSRFAAPSNGNGSFDLVVIDDSELVFDTGNNDLTFQIKFDHPSAVSSFTELLDVDLRNIAVSYTHLTLPTKRIV